MNKEWMLVNPCEECKRDPEISCKSTKFKFSPKEVYKKQIDSQKKLLEYLIARIKPYVEVANNMNYKDILWLLKSMLKQLEEKNG